MREFNVLNRSQPVSASAFLEASAGTGKTFAIEHLVVRTLLEGVTIDRILVVTFTKAATRELKGRIHNNLQAALTTLAGGSGPDYLEAIKEAGTVHRATTRLEEASLNFEEAKISTIHAFCFDALREHAFEGGMSLELARSQTLGWEEQLNVVRDLFSVGASPDVVTPAQLERLMGHFGYNFDRLAHRLLTGPTDTQLPSLAETLDALRSSLSRLRQQVDGTAFLGAFDELAPCYLGLANRQGQIKEEHRSNAEAFAALLDGELDLDLLIRQGCTFLDRIANGKLKRRAVPPDTPIPELLKQHLERPLKRVRDVGIIQRRLSAIAQKMLRQAMVAEESLTHDGLLEQMARATEDDTFCDAVRSRLDTVIVDEFQDTDPVQWQIFRRLFINQVTTVLVGDPKQSIYAFRKADIYSYLNARSEMNEDQRWSLSTSYRARPRLLEQLNQLFSSAPGFLALPKFDSFLPYERVKPGLVEEGSLAAEQPLRFLMVENEQRLFAYVASEIARLHRNHGVAYRDCAILVTDRYQARRMQRFLTNHHIPAQAARGTAFADSPILSRLREAAEATRHPHMGGKLKTALLALFGWTPDQIVAAERDLDARPVELFSRLKKTLDEEGTFAFVEQLLRAPTLKGEFSVAERLLSFPGGPDRLHEAYQIAAAVAHCPGCQLVEELIAMELKGEHPGDQGPLRPLSDEDAVPIQTVFASKGLEYRVVFALALGYRTPVGERDPEESDAEKGRLLYVALTRAKESLYLPIFPIQQGAFGSAAPIELFLSYPADSYDALYAQLASLDLNARLQGFTQIRIDSSPPITTAPKPQPVLCPPQPLSWPTRERWLQSYTGLAEHEAGERKQPEPDELPLGAETGIVLHDLLERVPLPLGDLETFVARRVAGGALEEWKPQIANLVKCALTCPIDDFCLLDVDPSHLMRETEFLFGLPEPQTIEEHQLQAGCVTGVIDLICYHQNRYYLIDWKSNWLPDYEQDTLHVEIKRASYRLQALLYTQALERYLKLTDPRPFEEIFGGAYYVFLRGPAVCKL